MGPLALGIKLAHIDRPLGPTLSGARSGTGTATLSLAHATHRRHHPSIALNGRPRTCADAASTSASPHCCGTMHP